MSRIALCLLLLISQGKQKQPRPRREKPGTWQAAASGTTVTLRGVCFGDAAHVWAVGDKGTILHSGDGGKTWQKQQSESDGTLRAVHFVDASRGWIVGDGDSAAPSPRGHVVQGRPMKAGTCLITSDGGKTWKRVWVHTNFELRSIFMASERVGQICNHGGNDHQDGDRMLTSDGGENWSQTRVYRGLNDCFWSDEQTAWAVGSPVVVGFLPEPTDELYRQKRARIVATTDGGKTWSPQPSPDLPGESELRSIWMYDRKTGVAVGDGGAICRTTDGGKSWTAVASGVQTNLYGVVVPSEKIGWAVGEQGVILQTQDGGKSWRVAAQAGKALFAVHAADGGKRAVAVGADGTIFSLQ